MSFVDDSCQPILPILVTLGILCCARNDTIPNEVLKVKHIYATLPAALFKVSTKMNPPNTPCLPNHSRRVIARQGRVMFVHSRRGVNWTAVLVLALLCHSQTLRN